MKRTLLGLSAFTLIAISAYFLLPKEEASYKSRTGIQHPGLYNGAKELREALIADDNGEVNPELIMRARTALNRYGRNDQSKSMDLGWVSMGPNNIGGRTRAVITDKDDPNTVYIGSVSGGVYKSTNGGAIWDFLESYNDNMAVSTIAQAGTGRVYVGAGHREDRFLGDGIRYSDDGGETWEVLVQADPTFSSGSDWIEVNEIEADPVDPNKIWIAYGGGLTVYDQSTDEFTEMLGPQHASSIGVSSDGQTIICAFNRQTYISRDGGENWIDMGGNDFGQVPSSSTLRLEVAISPDDADYMYACLANNGGWLKGVWASTNRGESFFEIAPNSEQGTLPFSPFSNGLTFQGDWDNVIEVVPGDPGKLILGGIRMHLFEMGTVTPPSGTWSNLNINFGSPENPDYVHSDVHRFHFDENGVLYIGTDGGIHKSTDNIQSFTMANFEYRSLQFYGMAFNSLGHVIGGTQDNGTHFIDGFGVDPNNSIEVTGGDGFDCVFSNYEPGFASATLYNNIVFRTFDGGQTVNSIGNVDFFATDFPGPFWTIVDYYERPDENLSERFITYELEEGESFEVGDVIEFESANFGYPLTHTVTQAVPFELDTGGGTITVDTIAMQDQFQTIFIMGGLGGFWMSRDVSNALVGATDIDWARIDGPLFANGTPTTFEFSPDGEFLYIGLNNGRLLRMGNLRSAYTQAEFEELGDTELVLMGSFGGSVSDIAIDQNNPDRLAITRSGYSSSSKLRLTEEAQAPGGSALFEDIWNMPDDIDLMPAYSVVFDINTPNRMIVGTEYGTWVSDDLGESWSEANDGMGRTPVYDLIQQNLTTDDIPFMQNEGAIYAGTHGRAFWYIGDYILSDESQEFAERFEDSAVLFPNPASTQTNLEFMLPTSEQVVVRIFDIQGREMKNLPQGQLMQGEQRIIVDVSDLPNGFYIMDVRAGAYTFNDQFVVRR